MTSKKEARKLKKRNGVDHASETFAASSTLTVPDSLVPPLEDPSFQVSSSTEDGHFRVSRVLVPFVTRANR
jgi:hypothetical protein